MKLKFCQLEPSYQRESVNFFGRATEGLQLKVKQVTLDRIEQLKVKHGLVLELKCGNVDHSPNFIASYTSFVYQLPIFFMVHSQCEMMWMHVEMIWPKAQKHVRHLLTKCKVSGPHNSTSSN